MAITDEDTIRFGVGPVSLGVNHESLYSPQAIQAPDRQVPQQLHARLDARRGAGWCWDCGTTPRSLSSSLTLRRAVADKAAFVFEKATHHASAREWCPTRILSNQSCRSRHELEQSLRLTRCPISWDHL